jgi:hypothetical protein
MFWPRFGQVLRRSAISGAVTALATTGAFAQTLGYGLPAQGTVHLVKVYQATPQDNSKALALLASLSAEAGIPFFAKPEAKPVEVAVSLAHPQEDEPALCIKTGVSVNPAFMSGPQMTLEHGLLGCPTNTAGIPVVLAQDPFLQPPPTSRTGQYDVDVTMRYRLMQHDRIKLVASLTEQGLAYSMDSAITGNNLLAALTMDF